MYKGTYLPKYDKDGKQIRYSFLYHDSLIRQSKKRELTKREQKSLKRGIYLQKVLAEQDGISP